MQESEVDILVLSRRHHKGNSVEYYHRFLNKTQAIASNDRGTQDFYIQNSKTSQYAWDIIPIDDTDVIRSMTDIGCIFRFSLDVDLSPTPILNSGSNSTLFNYLLNVFADSAYALLILQATIKEKRESHQQHQNNGKSAWNLKVGDSVRAHVQMQS